MSFNYYLSVIIMNQAVLSISRFKFLLLYIYLRMARMDRKERKGIKFVDKKFCSFFFISTDIGEKKYFNTYFPEWIFNFIPSTTIHEVWVWEEGEKNIISWLIDIKDYIHTHSTIFIYIFSVFFEKQKNYSNFSVGRSAADKTFEPERLASSYLLR